MEFPLLAVEKHYHTDQNVEEGEGGGTAISIVFEPFWWHEIGDETGWCYWKGLRIGQS